MTAPSSDSAAIRQTLRALKAAGYVLTYVSYGDDQVDVTKATEQETIDAIMAVDDADLLVATPAGQESYVRFVMGNEPFEVICDHGESLSPILDPLTRSWWDD